jgi:hypothetical protein
MCCIPPLQCKPENHFNDVVATSFKASASGERLPELAVRPLLLASLGLISTTYITCYITRPTDCPTQFIFQWGVKKLTLKCQYSESQPPPPLTIIQTIATVKSSQLTHECCFSPYQTKKTPWSESVSELYRPSDRCLSAKWLPTFADKGWHVVSVTDPYGRILGFLDRSRYFSIK